MPYLPQGPTPTPGHPRGGARVKLAERTPAVIRLADGEQISGRLQVISATGGLLALSRPLKPDSVVKLMFLVPTGSVLGEAQMLCPLAWSAQAFRFLTLHDDDESRLKAAIQSALERSAREDKHSRRDHAQIEKHRSW
jgi:hypothetical protein